jgi:hypothetical protein
MGQKRERHRPALERVPVRMRWCCGVGVAVTLLGLVAETAWPASNGLWAAPKADGSIADAALFRQRPLTCAKQLETWQRNAAKLGVSRRREADLTSALEPGRDHTRFAQARALLANEQQVRQQLEQAVRISRVNDQLGGRAALVLLILLIGVAVLWRLEAQPYATSVTTRQCGKPHIAFVTVGFSLLLLDQCIASVWATEKHWFGANSFCICPPAWVLSRVTELGVVMVLGVPFADAWSLATRTDTPPLTITHPDGRCGVGQYVGFLQHTTTIAVGVVAVLTALWLRYLKEHQTSADRIYVWSTMAGFLAVGALVWWLIVNTLKVRREWENSRAALGATWKEVKAADPAPDPTEEFLGSGTWKLLATVAAILAAVWTVLQWSGTSQTVVDALK